MKQRQHTPTGSVRGEAAHRGGPRESAAEAPRYAEFDALRATAIGLVVALHSALAYTRLDIPRLLWGVREPGQSGWFDQGCWWAMAVSVPLFFAISGFFASMAVAARGAERFWQGRVRRVVVPSFAAAPVILPLCFAAWAAGWLVTDRCTWREVLRLRYRDPAIESALYGPAHLWFVEYLIPILWAYGLARPAARSSRSIPTAPSPWRTGGRRWPWRSRRRCCCSSTAAGPGWMPGSTATTRSSPSRSACSTSGRSSSSAPRSTGRPGSLDRLRRRGPWLLLASAPVFAFRGWMLPLDWAGDAPWSFSVLAAGALALGSWLAVFGLIGTYRRIFTRPDPVARYLAAASFWVYLVHLPIVGFLIQADLYGVAIPPAVKFALTLGVTVALGLGSYEVFVRRTALGRFLDGRVAAAGTGRGAATRRGADQASAHPARSAAVAAVIRRTTATIRPAASPT